MPLLYALLAPAEIALYLPRVLPSRLDLSNYQQVLRQVPIPLHREQRRCGERETGLEPVSEQTGGGLHGVRVFAAVMV